MPLNLPLLKLGVKTLDSQSLMLFTLKFLRKFLSFSMNDKNLKTISLVGNFNTNAVNYDKRRK